MEKMNPFYTATAAAILYFIIFVMLKYLLQNRVVDLWGALSGAVVFWIVIFLVHQLLIRWRG